MFTISAGSRRRSIEALIPNWSSNLSLPPRNHLPFPQTILQSSEIRSKGNDSYTQNGKSPTSLNQSGADGTFAGRKGNQACRDIDLRGRSGGIDDVTVLSVSFIRSVIWLGEDVNEAPRKNARDIGTPPTPGPRSQNATQRQDYKSHPRTPLTGSYKSNSVQLVLSLWHSPQVLTSFSPRLG